MGIEPRDSADIFLDEIGLPAARRALVLDANDPEALTLMAVASQKTSQSFAEALKLLDAALEIDPDYFEAHIEIATLYLRLGEFQFAKDHFQYALEFSVTSGQKEQAGQLMDQYFPQ